MRPTGSKMNTSALGIASASRQETASRAVTPIRPASESIWCSHARLFSRRLTDGKPKEVEGRTVAMACLGVDRRPHPRFGDAGRPSPFESGEGHIPSVFMLAPRCGLIGALFRLALSEKGGDDYATRRSILFGEALFLATSAVRCGAAATPQKRPVRRRGMDSADKLSCALSARGLRQVGFGRSQAARSASLCSTGCSRTADSTLLPDPLRADPPDREGYCGTDGGVPA